MLRSEYQIISCGARGIRYIQALLGHEKLDTTARYTRVATGRIATIDSPLKQLGRQRAKKKGRSTSAGWRRPTWLSQVWRSRTSSATTAPLGVKPTAAMSAWSK